MNTFTLVYPNDFEGSERMVPGRYQVEWRSAPLVDPLEGGRSLLYAQLGQTLTRPLATDAFTIPEGVVSGWQRETPRAPEAPEPESTENPQNEEESSDPPS